MTTLTGTSPALSDTDGRQNRRTRATEDDLERLVESIRIGDPAAVERLYEILGRGLRFLVVRWTGLNDADDLVHDTLLAVVEGIQSGRLREPRALLGYARAIARNLSLTLFRKSGRLDELDAATTEPVLGGESQEERMLQNERLIVLNRVLQGLNYRQREILTRCYVLEEPREQICTEMDLTATQYRLLKWRAKSRVVEIAKSSVYDAPRRIGPQSAPQAWSGKNLANARSA